MTSEPEYDYTGQESIGYENNVCFNKSNIVTNKIPQQDEDNMPYSGTSKSQAYKFPVRHTYYTCGERHELSYKRKEASVECVKIGIFGIESFCFMVSMFFDHKVFSIFFEKCISNVISYIIICCCSNKYCYQWNYESYQRIHSSLCRKNSYSKERYFWWKGE